MLISPWKSRILLHMRKNAFENDTSPEHAKGLRIRIRIRIRINRGSILRPPLEWWTKWGRFLHQGGKNGTFSPSCHTFDWGDLLCKYVCTPCGTKAGQVFGHQAPTTVSIQVTGGFSMIVCNVVAKSGVRRSSPPGHRGGEQEGAASGGAHRYRRRWAGA